MSRDFSDVLKNNRGIKPKARQIARMREEVSKLSVPILEITNAPTPLIRNITPPNFPR